jgi:multidrug efflux pump subunit AcrA (membrane-fusion protein)
VLVAVFACSTETPKIDEAINRRETLVKTIPAEATDSYKVSRRYNGVLKTRRTTELSFLRGGMLKEIRFDMGDQVSQGEVVATLDTASLEAQESSLKAQLRKAESRVLELRRGPRIEPRKAALANIRRQRATLALAEKKLARRQELYRQGAIPLEALDESSSEVSVLKESLAALAQESAELESGTRPEIIAQAQADVDQLQAQIQALQVDFRDSVLVAPYSGRVSQRLVDDGAVVSAGSPVLNLDEGVIYEAWLDLPLEETLEPVLEMELGGTKIKGTLVGEPPRVDPNSLTQTARYLVNGGRPGESVAVSIESRVEESGFWLPTDAVTASGDGLWTCYTVDGDSQVAVQNVEVIHREDDRVLVRGSLGSADRVIREGLDSVVPGQKVKVSR